MMSIPDCSNSVFVTKLFGTSILDELAFSSSARRLLFFITCGHRRSAASTIDSSSVCVTKVTYVWAGEHNKTWSGYLWRSFRTWSCWSMTVVTSPAMDWSFSWIGPIEELLTSSRDDKPRWYRLGSSCKDRPKEIAIKCHSHSSELKENSDGNESSYSFWISCILNEVFCRFHIFYDSICFWVS